MLPCPYLESLDAGPVKSLGDISGYPNPDAEPWWIPVSVLCPSDRDRKRALDPQHGLGSTWPAVGICREPAAHHCGDALECIFYLPARPENPCVRHVVQHAFLTHNISVLAVSGLSFHALRLPVRCQEFVQRRGGGSQKTPITLYEIALDSLLASLPLNVKIRAT